MMAITYELHHINSRLVFLRVRVLVHVGVFIPDENGGWWWLESCRRVARQRTAQYFSEKVLTARTLQQNSAAGWAPLLLFRLQNALTGWPR